MDDETTCDQTVEPYEWRELWSDDGMWAFTRVTWWNDAELVVVRDMRGYGDDDLHGQEAGCIHVESGSLDLNVWNAETWLDDEKRETIIRIVRYMGMRDDHVTLPESVALWFADRRNQALWTAATTGADTSADLAALHELQRDARQWVALTQAPGWLAWEMDRYSGICDEPFQAWHTTLAGAMLTVGVPQEALQDQSDWFYKVDGWGATCSDCYAEVFPRERHARYAAARVAEGVFGPLGDTTAEWAIRDREHLSRVVANYIAKEHEDAPAWYGDGTPRADWLDLTDEHRAEIAEAGYAADERAGLIEAM